MLTSMLQLFHHYSTESTYAVNVSVAFFLLSIPSFLSFVSLCAAKGGRGFFAFAAVVHAAAIDGRILGGSGEEGRRI